jgi:hypothetical protein
MAIEDGGILGVLDVKTGGFVEDVRPPISHSLL